MLKTYLAKLKQNKLQWIDDKPESDSKSESVLVYVTIVNEDKKSKKSKSNIVEFFKNSPLYDSNLEIDPRNDYGREVDL